MFPCLFSNLFFLLVHLFLFVYLSVCLFCEAVERCSMFAYFQVADNNLRSFKSNWNLELTCSSPPFKLDLYLHATILNRHRYNNGKQMESEKEGWGQQRWQRSRIHRAGTHSGFLKVVLVKGRKKGGKRLQRVENEHQQPKGHSVNQQPKAATFPLFSLEIVTIVIVILIIICVLFFLRERSGWEWENEVPVWEWEGPDMSRIAAFMTKSINPRICK